MRKLKYISLELDKDSRSKLRNILYRFISEDDFCYLKYKGGDVTGKAHLTLLFGLPFYTPESEMQDEFDEALEDLRFLQVDDLEIFNLGKAKCSALVVRVDSSQLSKWHKYFKEKYGLDPSFKDEKDFKAHITLAYVKKDFKLNKDKLTNLQLKVEEIKLKTFTYR